MEMIKHLQIKNYKSIKQLDLDCNRINVFVGRPNVGKSNILEALALDQLSSFMQQNQLSDSTKKPQTKIDFKNIFRVAEARNLFHSYETDNPIELKFDFSLGSFDNYPRLKIEHVPGEDVFLWKREGAHLSTTAFTKAFDPIVGDVVIDTMTKHTIDSKIGYSSKINYYDFNGRVYEEGLYHNEGGYPQLLSPYGNNILSIIERLPLLRKKIGEIFHDTGFDFVLDKVEGNLKIQRNENGIIFSVPYISIADTLQRLVFYLCAIESNQYGRILLEEPEVHSFPPFVSYLADEIIESSNQFFIVTHSPYLLTELIEKSDNDVSIFACGYDTLNFNTTARKLTDSDLSELLDYGVDIFFNINGYSDDKVEHSS
jgi:AAA15 family ATPase/GTPase